MLCEGEDFDRTSHLQVGAAACPENAQGANAQSSFCDDLEDITSFLPDISSVAASYDSFFGDEARDTFCFEEAQREPWTPPSFCSTRVCSPVRNNRVKKQKPVRPTRMDTQKIRRLKSSGLYAALDCKEAGSTVTHVKHFKEKGVHLNKVQFKMKDETIQDSTLICVHTVVKCNRPCDYERPTEPECREAKTEDRVSRMLFADEILSEEPRLPRKRRMNPFVVRKKIGKLVRISGASRTVSQLTHRNVDGRSVFCSQFL